MASIIFRTKIDWAWGSRLLNKPGQTQLQDMILSWYNYEYNEATETRKDRQREKVKGDSRGIYVGGLVKKKNAWQVKQVQVYN